jgi:hypothetical protein
MDRKHSKRHYTSPGNVLVPTGWYSNVLERGLLRYTIRPNDRTVVLSVYLVVSLWVI